MEVENSKSMTSIVWHSTAVYAAVALFALWYGYRWLQNRNEHSRFRILTSKMDGPKAWPIFGNMLQFIGSSEMFLDKMMKMTLDYGPEPFRFWVGPYLFIVVLQPEDLQVVLNSSKALDRPLLYDFMFGEWGENNIFVAKGKTWRHKRSEMMNSSFRISDLHEYFSIFHEKNQSLIENLNTEVGKTELFDLWEYIADTNLDSMFHVLVGYDLKQQPYGSLTTVRIAIELYFKMMGLRVFSLWLYPSLIFKSYLRFTGNSKVINRGVDVIDQVISIKKEEFKQKKTLVKEYPSDITDEKHKNWFETIMESSDKLENFSDKYIRDEIVILLGAGSESVTITTCFCLLMLAIHQDIQNKVYDEIYNVLGDGGEVMTMEDTVRLVYLEQVIKETMRIYPLVPLIVREIQEDIKISSGNHVIPKGTSCLMNLMATHSFSKLYPNPRVFNPDNFNKENIATRHKYSFMGFSGGARNCIGNRYAMQYLKVQLSMILRHFSVHTNITMDDIKVKTDMLLRSVNGYPVTIRSRKTRSTFK